MSDDDRRAINAISNILRDAETANWDRSITATHVVAVLRNNGWRPTNAGRHQPWQPTPGEALGPDIVHQCAAQVRQALTEALERAAQIEGTHAATGGQP